MLNPRTVTQFRGEHAQLTAQLNESLALERRLNEEVEAGLAQSAAGGELPPGFAEAQWLLSRERRNLEVLRNKLDRLLQRRNEVITAAVLARLRERFPADVAEIEQQVAAAFENEGAE